MEMFIPYVLIIVGNMPFMITHSEFETEVECRENLEIMEMFIDPTAVGHVASDCASPNRIDYLYNQAEQERESIIATNEGI